MNIEARRTQEIEAWYSRRLKEVAAQVSNLIHMYSGQPEALEAALKRYARDIEDWSIEVSGRMLRKADALDYSEWLKASKKITQKTRQQLRSAVTGGIFRELQDSQVELIKSLPLQAAEKAHEIVEEANLTGARFTDYVEQINNLGKISESRAVLIARTETSRARANFTQARAIATGSRFYRWHSSHDSRVRDMHKDLDGRIFSWDAPPVAGIGKGGEELHAHPGCIFNCRCTAERLFDGFNFNVSDK